MTDLVNPDQIETIVGARRRRLTHTGRAVSSEQTVYVLHSEHRKATTKDLRQCPYSRALDTGIDSQAWAGAEDRAMVVGVRHGRLVPLYAADTEQAGSDRD